MIEDKFHLGDLLTVASGIMVSFDGKEGLERLMGFILGEPVVWGAGIGPQAYACRVHLLSPHPWLAEVDYTAVNVDNWHEWLVARVAQYGAWHTVTALLR